MPARPGHLDIRRAEHLAKRLGVPLAKLRALADEAEKHSSLQEEEIRGKKRPLNIADAPLKDVHERIKTRLLDPLPPSPGAHAYVKGRDTVSCALPHIGKPFLLVVDIKDFFPTVRYPLIYRLFCDLGCSPDVAHLLTLLMTCRGKLPQGFKTSNALSNLVLRPIDKWLERACADWKVTYTRYCDNLYISGGGRVYKLLPIIVGQLRAMGFQTNREKTRVMARSEPQVVCGLVVNKKLNVPEHYYRAVRAETHLLRQHFLNGGEAKTAPSEIPSLRGKIAYISRVNAQRGSGLLRELQRIVPRGEH